MSRSAGLCGEHFKIRGKPRMQDDSWGLSQHHRPLNEKNDQLSPALLKTHLHPVRFHYGHGAAPELAGQDWACVCTDHAGQALINLTQLTGPADSWFSRDKIFFPSSSSSAPPFPFISTFMFSLPKAGDCWSNRNPNFILIVEFIGGEDEIFETWKLIALCFSHVTLGLRYFTHTPSFSQSSQSVFRICSFFHKD